MEIDVETVAGVAVEFEQSAVVLNAIADSVSKLAFGPDGAGRNYADVGTRIATAYEDVELLFRRWREATEDNAVRLRSSVASYSRADGRTADRIDSAGSR